MLELRYLPDTQEVQASFTGGPSLWPIIKASFEETTREVTTTSSSSLLLPLWAFLSCRKALAYITRKHSIPLSVDDLLADYLRRALASERTYRDSIGLLPIGEQALNAKLRSEGFARSLTAEQLRNLLYLCRLPAGATFSVPGAGKTTEAIAFFLFKRLPDSRLLVVCPKNALATWEEQLQLCVSPQPRSVRLTGGERQIELLLHEDPPIALISYQQLANVRHLVARHMSQRPYFMFLDESHHIKRGPEGYWGGSVLSLSHLPLYKLIMTGTPLPNALADLVPQFGFLYPEIDATDNDAATLVQPIFVRTTKSELHLPPVEIAFTPIRLRDRHFELYEVIRSEEARSLSVVSPRDRMLLRRLGRSAIRLLQAVSNPALILDSDLDVPSLFSEVLLEGDSPKIEYACYKARLLAREGRKCVIWSIFVRNVETIADRLADIGAEFIHGGVEAGSEEESTTREYKLRRFHEDPSAYVLVANPAACSEAISLHTVCHHAIYIDRNYNVTQFLQSQDRIHRLGLPPDVKTTVEILVSPRTIDESVSRRLAAKATRMAAVLDDRSLEVEPYIPDPENDELDPDDISDLLKHISQQ